MRKIGPTWDGLTTARQMKIAIDRSLAHEARLKGRRLVTRCRRGAWTQVLEPAPWYWRLVQWMRGRR
jgi:hypothetical protein